MLLANNRFASSVALRATARTRSRWASTSQKICPARSWFAAQARCLAAVDRMRHRRPAKVPC